MFVYISCLYKLLVYISWLSSGSRQTVLPLAREVLSGMYSPDPGKSVLNCSAIPAKNDLRLLRNCEGGVKINLMNRKTILINNKIE